VPARLSVDALEVLATAPARALQVQQHAARIGMLFASAPRENARPRP
jgi:hypothetical protein